MKTNTFLLFIFLASSNFLLSQEVQDSLEANSIYAPNQLNDSFSAEESWEIHRAAYIKQLKSKGLSDDEIKNNMVSYERNKEEFIARVKEQYRLAAIQRKKAFEQRALIRIERKKADAHRKLAAVQRQKAEDLRKLANLERKKAEKQRGKDTGQREKANELRKQAEIERAKAEEQRKLAEIQREKARAQRMKVQEWRNNAETILLKNIKLSNHSDNKSVAFKVTSKGTLQIGIRAHISSGSTLIEIYNPQGSKEGELSLKFNTKSGSNENRGDVEYTSGALDKTISDTELGEWQIKISSQRSEGTLAMSVLQYVKPSMDE